MAKGVELATEWVTILPETATLVKRLKEFKPEPIKIPVSIAAGSGSKSPEKQGEALGKAIDKGVVTATKDTGQKIGQNMKLDEKPVQAAATNAGKVIKAEVIKQSKEAGKKAGEAVAQEIEKQKGKVAAASQKLADARRAEENIASRIRSSESKISQARDDTGKKAKMIARLEEEVSNLRASSEENAAARIRSAESKIAQLTSQRERQLVRLNAMEESHGRLLNTQATNQGRAASAANNLMTQEAMLASAIASQAKPMEDLDEQGQKSKSTFGKMSAALIPLGKQLLVTSGLFTGAIGIGGGISYVFKTGNEFTDSMNKMQGITNATGTEMQALNDKARALGRDFMLPATSANDAAMTMLELTKAGFTVQQAMDAARGSLQLAAAAGIDSAEAATITGTSLNAFGLEANQASKVTDILANAANLFPGEMKDFGYSLSQSGAVAKSFGISIEDTTTALGFLAKAGIKSSDAGTLIKTMLLSLTDQGKPAQAAIKELGLELYDQQHHFKGIEYVYKRLNQASKEMTQEQYQAATATLFGTDAARFSGLAAGESAPNWDEFRKRIDETATAARVADARMQGIPGALERLKNAIQSIGLTIYDSVKGPIEAVINGIAAAILKFDEWLNGPIIQWLKQYKDEIMGVAIVLGTYATALGVVKAAQIAMNAVLAIADGLFAMSGIGTAVVAIAALVAGVIYAYKHFDWFKKAVDAVWGWMKSTWPTIVQVAKKVWDAIAAGVMWFVNNVWKREWEAAKAVWSVVWFAIQVGFQAWKKWFGIIGDVMSSVWNGVIKPVFSFIGEHAKALWEIMKIAWGGIKIAIEAVWQWLQPIMQPFKDFFSGIGDVGKKAGEAIKAAWSGLWNILKMPLHGLGDLLAGLPEEFLGVKVPFIADIHNWGKSLQGLAVGGIAGRVISGPGTGTSDSIVGINQMGIPTVRVSDGEGIVPAAVLKTPLGRSMFNFMLGNVDSGGLKPPYDNDQPDTGLPIPQQIPGQFPKRFGPGGMPGEDPHWITDFPWIGWPGPPFKPNDPWRQNRKNVGGLFNRLPGLEGGGTVSLGNISGPGITTAEQQSMWDAIRAAFPNAVLSSATRTVQTEGHPDFHNAGRAIDLSGPNMGAMASWIAKNYPDSLELIHSPFGHNIKNGKDVGDGVGLYGAGTMSGHQDHVHWALGHQAISGAFGDGAGSAGITGGSTAPGSAGSGTHMLGNGNVVNDKKVREAQDRLEDRTKQLDLAKERLQEFLDKKNAGKDVKQSTIDGATNQVEKFTRELEEAKADLATAQQGSPAKSRSSKRGSSGEAGGTGEQDWSSVGKMIFSGFLESFGFDGSVFTNLFDTPNFKSAMAGVNFLGGLLGGGESESGGGWAGDSGGGGGLLDAAGGMLSGVGDIMGMDLAPNGGAGDAGPAIGADGRPFINQDFSNSSFGDFQRKDFEDYATGKQQEGMRRYPGLVAGGAK